MLPSGAKGARRSLIHIKGAAWKLTKMKPFRAPEQEAEMKLKYTLAAAAIALAAPTGPQMVQAQNGRQKMFFEGDMVNGQGSGPSCVLQNQFKQGQTVVWRVRILDQTGKRLNNKDVKSLIVELPDGQKFSMRYGPHPRGKTDDYFWASSWKVPINYPTGTFSYKVVATGLDGQTHDWAPFNVDSSELTIIE
jgi:hypothetical protein